LLLIFCVGRHSCKVNCHTFLISNYPCIVTRGNDSNITRTKFFLCAIVHNNFHSSRNHILCMWCLTTICFRYRLYAFLPTPSRLELGSSYRNFTKSRNLYFALFKCSFIWCRVKVFLIIFAIEIQITNDLIIIKHLSNP